MTIYDRDYVAQEELQNEYAGVEDPVAVDQEAVAEEVIDESGAEENLQEGYQEQAEESEEENLSDKEMNFKAMREEIARMKAEKEALEENFDLWKRELALANSKDREPEAARDSLADIEDDDYVSGAQLKKLMQEREEKFQASIKEQEMYQQESRVRSQYADYDEVATKYGVPLLKQEPDLAQAFMASQNKATFLYKLGKMQQLSEAPPPEPSNFHKQEVNKAQRIVANAKKPGTLSNAVSGQQAISRADYFASMSDADFAKLVSKNLEEV